MKVVGAHVVLHKLMRTREDNDAIQAVLLCKRTQDAPIHPRHWSLFGGKVKTGEMPEKAVRREVKEELEIRASP